MSDNKASHQRIEATIKDEKSLEFLLKEYDRLVEYQKVTIEDYNRLFNVYLGIVSAVVIGAAPLSQVIPSSNVPLVSNLVLLSLLFVGTANFLGLSTASVRTAQFERGIRLIQSCFIEREPNTSKYLYFQVNQVGIPGAGLRALIARGLTGGSPKSLLVLLNSTIASVLVVKVGVEMGYWGLGISPAFFVGASLFIVVVALHLSIARITYRIHLGV